MSDNIVNTSYFKYHKTITKVELIFTDTSIILASLFHVFYFWDESLFINDSIKHL